jgi:hypothetical protein
MVCLIGFMLLGSITKYMQGNINTASKVFFSGIAMGWVNIMVQLVIPDATAIGVGYAEFVSTFALVCLLQVTLYPSITWHCSRGLI